MSVAEEANYASGIPLQGLFGLVVIMAEMSE